MISVIYIWVYFPIQIIDKYSRLNLSFAIMIYMIYEHYMLTLCLLMRRKKSKVTWNSYET